MVKDENEDIEMMDKGNIFTSQNLNYSYIDAFV